MTTLREHLEAIRDLHGLNRDGWCEWCEHPYPCVDHQHAVAALAILDAAHVRPARPPFSTPHRLVPDPEPTT